MWNQRETGMLVVLPWLSLLLLGLISGTNGACGLLSMDTDTYPCSTRAFSECSNTERSSINVTSATVTVVDQSVDATDAANSIIQCREKTCIELVYFLLVQYSQQFCFTLDDQYGPSLTLFSATITVSYTGGSQSSFSVMFDNSYFTGDNFQQCISFTLSSTPGPNSSPSASSSLNVYEHELCEGQAAAATPSATTTLTTTQPAATTHYTSSGPVTDTAAASTTAYDGCCTNSPTEDEPLMESTTTKSYAAPSSPKPKAHVKSSVYSLTKDNQGRNVIGYCLTDHVIETVQAVSQIRCAMMCNSVVGCKSFNYKDGVCELNEESKENVGSSYFSQSDGCTYYELGRFRTI